MKLLSLELAQVDNGYTLKAWRDDPNGTQPYCTHEVITNRRSLMLRLAELITDIEGHQEPKLRGPVDIIPSEWVPLAT